MNENGTAAKTLIISRKKKFASAPEYKTVKMVRLGSVSPPMASTY